MSFEHKSIFDEDLRPSLFQQMIGFDAEKRRLTATIASGHIPRIIYLTGPTGVGKTTMARLIARSVKCLNRTLGIFEPCGSCDNCISLSNESLMEYEEVFACKLDETYVDDLKFELRREENILFIDEIQDASKDLQKKIRSNLGSPRALIIFATTHRHEIEDALFNRLKSFEYQLRRPTVAEGATYLKEEFEKLKISYQSEQQLARIVVGLDREMRPCAEFPRKVVAEANGILTDDYLDQLFGPQEIIPNESIHSTDEWAV